jgi:hypothetical protein
VRRPGSEDPHQRELKFWNVQVYGCFTSDCQNEETDETGEDDKVGDNLFEECVWLPWELKSVLGYKGTLVSLGLPRTGVTLDY